MLEGGGGSVMYLPKGESTLILKNEVTPYGLQSFIQGRSLTWAVDPGHYAAILHPPFFTT